MKTRSEFSSVIYDSDEMIYITNMKQAAKYIKHHATLYDVIECGGKVVFVFSKKETKSLYEAWNAHTLD